MQTKMKVKNEKAEKKLVESDMVKRAMPDAFLQTTRGRRRGVNHIGSQRMCAHFVVADFCAL